MQTKLSITWDNGHVAVTDGYGSSIDLQSQTCVSVKTVVEGIGDLYSLVGLMIFVGLSPVTFSKAVVRRSSSVQSFTVSTKTVCDSTIVHSTILGLCFHCTFVLQSIDVLKSELLIDLCRLDHVNVSKTHGYLDLRAGTYHCKLHQNIMDCPVSEDDQPLAHAFRRIRVAWLATLLAPINQVWHCDCPNKVNGFVVRCRDRRRLL